MEKLKTLTLDLGTRTGWAIVEVPIFPDVAAILRSGTLLLATDEELQAQREAGKERTLDIRFVRLLSFIQRQVQEENLQRIVFEDVQFASTQMQAQLWAGLRAAIWAVAAERQLEVFCVPVGTLKVFATGTGNAKKPDMARALAEADPGIYLLTDETLTTKTNPPHKLDDNEVDALWLAKFNLAVERKEHDYLGVYQRKLKEKKAKREKKKQKKLEAKQKLIEAVAHAKIKKSRSSFWR